MYTVKQVGKISGVSVRTLHHYHAIGLLVPAHIGANQYRYYAQAELLRLQQILFYRQLGFPLRDITSFLETKKGLNHIDMLANHRETLLTQVRTTHTLIQTIERTIAHLKGQMDMTHTQLYEGFSSEKHMVKQEAYEAWLVKNGRDSMRERIKVAKEKMVKSSKSQRKSNMVVLQNLEAKMAACMVDGLSVDSQKMISLLRQHRDWVSAQWGRECTHSAYSGLADMYAAHQDFVARYESIANGFTKYLCDAMKTYSQRA